jgi:hypothetical protein
MVVLKSIVGLVLFASLFAIIAPPRRLGAHGSKMAIAAALACGALLVAMKERATPTFTEAAVIPQETKVAQEPPKPAQETPKPQPALASSQIPVPSAPKPAPGRTTDLRDGVLKGEHVDVIRVSAMNLFREYERNEVATDMRLQGSIVEISGQVASVNKDFLDNAYVELKTPNQFMSASMRPVASDTDKIARLRKGQIVTFRCENMSRSFGAPSGRKCVLID